MNPALPGGASGADTSLGEERWAASARTAYTFVPYARLQQGTRAAPNQDGLAIDVHLGTLQLQAAAPTGTSLDLQLPLGALTTRSLAERRTDLGVGDLELRVRQSAGRYLARPRLGLAAGLALPTGAYTARAGAANLPPEAVALTLGRGVAWWIAEADARQAVHARATLLAQLSARGPLMRASDGFGWGPEVRVTAGARVDAIARRLAFTVTADLQWRGGATEPDPFSMSGSRIDTANVGGWFSTLTPSAVIELGGGATASVGARIPVYNDVAGNQLVAGLGGFAALSYARPLTARARPPRVQPAPGQLTVVDYGATWCAPCAEIDRLLAAARARWPDVRIVRVDASGWPGEGAPGPPPGASGLPAIEIFDEAGARIELLLGADALRVVERVDALRARRSAGGAAAPEVR